MRWLSGVCERSGLVHLRPRRCPLTGKRLGTEEIKSMHIRPPTHDRYAIAAAEGWQASMVALLRGGWISVRAANSITELCTALKDRGQDSRVVVHLYCAA